MARAEVASSDWAAVQALAHSARKRSERQLLRNAGQASRRSSLSHPGRRDQPARSYRTTGSAGIGGVGVGTGRGGAFGGPTTLHACRIMPIVKAATADLHAVFQLKYSLFMQPHSASTRNHLR